MSIALKLKNALTIALEAVGVQGIEFTLEHPTELSHGDYACNVAMVCAKQLGKSPKSVAQEIISELEKQKIPEIETISLAGPGFINFTLSKDFFAQEIPDILKSGDDFGKSEMYHGKKILIEHSSPNLFKPFHIGHMMNNAIGESLTRLMKYSGADVYTMSFPSDISLGIAKAIFIILEKYGADFVPTDVAVLGDAYVEGTKRYDEDESIKEKVYTIAENLFAGKSSPEWNVFQACKKFNIEYFEMVVGKLGSSFDSYIYESEAGVVGKEIVEKNIGKIFTKSEGAVVYIPDESKKHLNTAVFINSQGNPTYEAKDIGLLDLKFSRIHPDLSLFVTDHEQIPHFDIVLDAAEKINKDWAEKSVHIPHGRMSFKGQKMSSRLGGVPLATDMIDAVSEEAQTLAKNKDHLDQIKNIAIAAIKFAILRVKPGMNINFDPETSLSFEGDSGPYLQYTHARIMSLLDKGKIIGINPKYQQDQEISDVERMAYRFPEIVELAVTEYAPQYVVTYLLQLAQAFNSYYGSHKIVDSENNELSAHRLMITQSVGQVLKNGLWLLGIVAPKEM